MLKPRPFRISLLLWFADKLYDLNAWVLGVSNYITARINHATGERYTRIAVWCWKQLARHATDEEALRVGNRRLAPLGLVLVNRPHPVEPEAVWASRRVDTSEMN